MAADVILFYVFLLSSFICSFMGLSCYNTCMWFETQGHRHSRMAQQQMFTPDGKDREMDDELDEMNCGRMNGGRGQLIRQ